MQRRIRLAVVDDQPLFRDGVISSLANSREIAVSADGTTEADAICIGKDCSPDVMLISFKLPADTVVAAWRFRSQFPSVKTIILTHGESAEPVAAAIKVGIHACVGMHCTGSELVKVVRATQRADAGRPPGPIGHFPLTDILTNRENLVLQLMALGLRNRDIERRLGKTFRSRMTEIIQTLSECDRAEASGIADRSYDLRNTGSSVIF